MKIAVVIIVLNLLFACSYKPISKDIRERFTNKLEGKSTNIRSLLNIDGYYQFWERGEFLKNNRTGKLDSFFVQMLFYEDGSFVYSFFFRQPFPPDVDSCLMAVARNGIGDEFYIGSYWGAYKIDGDTIKAQYINNVSRSYLAPWFGGEFWLKVIKYNEIKIVYMADLQKMNDQDIRSNKEMVSKFTNGKFHPLDTIPPPHGWVKKERWIWRNEADWKKYVETLVKLSARKSG